MEKKSDEKRIRKFLDEKMKEFQKWKEKKKHKKYMVVDESDSSHSSDDDTLVVEKVKKHKSKKRHRSGHYFYFMSSTTAVVVPHRIPPVPPQTTPQTGFPNYFVSWNSTHEQNLLGLVVTPTTIQFTRCGTFFIQWKIQLDVPAVALQENETTPSPSVPTAIIYPETRNPPLVNVAWYLQNNIPSTYTLISPSQATVFETGHRFVEGFFVLSVNKGTIIRLGIETMLDNDILVAEPILDPNNAFTIFIRPLVM